MCIVLYMNKTSKGIHSPNCFKIFQRSFRKHFSFHKAGPVSPGLNGGVLEVQIRSLMSFNRMHFLRESCLGFKLSQIYLNWFPLSLNLKGAPGNHILYLNCIQIPYIASDFAGLVHHVLLPSAS